MVKSYEKIKEILKSFKKKSPEELKIETMRAEATYEDIQELSKDSLSHPNFRKLTFNYETPDIPDDSERAYELWESYGRDLYYDISSFKMRLGNISPRNESQNVINERIKIIMDKITKKRKKLTEVLRRLKHPTLAHNDKIWPGEYGQYVGFDGKTKEHYAPGYSPEELFEKFLNMTKEDRGKYIKYWQGEKRLEKSGF
ncbi:MAG: hypothetical protein FJZ04_02195 [Candidatus Moranbacteria bacterium]|nr:hypothetical protein [Candidatus Moranbacteria bacterium]